MTALRDRGIEPQDIRGWNLLKDHHVWHCDRCEGESFVSGESQWHHPLVAEKDCFFCGKGKMHALCPQNCVGFDVDLLPSRTIFTYLSDCYHHRDSRISNRKSEGKFLERIWTRIKKEKSE